MRTIPIFAITLLLPGMALAACPPGSETLVSCTFKNGAKQLDTCLIGNQALYRYGPSGGQPELDLAAHVRDVGMIPWPGIGRSIWEAVIFRNADISYEVSYSIDRDPENSEMQGGITVMKGDKMLAVLECDPGSVVSGGYSLPLFEAKERAGQCWRFDSRDWGDC